MSPYFNPAADLLTDRRWVGHFFTSWRNNLLACGFKREIRDLGGGQISDCRQCEKHECLRNA